MLAWENSATRRAPDWMFTNSLRCMRQLLITVKEVIIGVQRYCPFQKGIFCWRSCGH